MNPHRQAGQADHIRFHNRDPGSQGTALETRKERPEGRHTEFLGNTQKKACHKIEHDLMLNHENAGITSKCMR